MKGIKIFLKKKKQKYAHEKYQNLSEEEKDKILEYCRKHHKKLSENEKQRTAKYRRNYYIIQKR